MTTNDDPLARRAFSVRGLAYTMLALYVVPLLMVGLWKLRHPVS